jgi:hypothetical protein
LLRGSAGYLYAAIFLLKKLKHFPDANSSVNLLKNSIHSVADKIMQNSSLSVTSIRVQNQIKTTSNTKSSFGNSPYDGEKHLGMLKGQSGIIYMLLQSIKHAGW